MANKTGMTIIDTFLYGGKKYLDQREEIGTISELLTTDENIIPDGFITYCKEDKKRYIYHSSNSSDPTTGKWREYMQQKINIVNDLTSGGADSALSAEQGKILNSTKQATLIGDRVDGQNIKTINGESILGKGDLQISSGGTISVVDNLTEGGRTKALSAEQGKVLNEKITSLNTTSSGDGSFITDVSQNGGLVSAVKGKGNAVDVKVDPGSAGIYSTDVQSALKEIYTSGKVTITSSSPEESNVVKRYTIQQNSNTIGTIDIPTDMVVQSGEMVKGTWNDTVFTESASGKDLALKLSVGNNKNVYINPKGLVNIYKAGSGLELLSDTFTAKIDNTSVSSDTNYLTVSDNGLRVSLADLTNKDQVETDKFITSVKQTSGKITIEKAFIGASEITGENECLDVTVSTDKGKVSTVTINNKKIFNKDNISTTMPDGVGSDDKVLSEKLTKSMFVTKNDFSTIDCGEF